MTGSPIPSEHTHNTLHVANKLVLAVVSDSKYVFDETIDSGGIPDDLNVQDVEFSAHGTGSPYKGLPLRSSRR